MINLQDLNPAQREAVVTTEGPLLILAGAGSGKTRVITYRIAYLIEHLDVCPESILAITFTNKAANEMKERIHKLIGSNSKGMWTGTFHSICVRILRREIDKVGYTSNFVIYDTSDQKTLLKQCLKELNINEANCPIKYLQSEISKAKNELIDSTQYFNKYSSDFRLSKVAEIYKLYQKKLSSNNALDFDDIIFKTIELFKNNELVLDYYRKIFKYVLVDEYQDTNAAQYELISMFASLHKNLCVVGDDDQSIYGWRGADISNILDFEKQFKDAKSIKLEQNYRSSSTILEAANCVIKNNSGRKSKNLWTDKPGGEQITYFLATDEHDEANFVSNEIIKNVMKSGSEYNQFAILYRTNAQSRVFEELFMKMNIPYKIIGGQKFYDRKEIKDIIAYLRVIQNVDDSVGLKRIINVPKRAIGETTVAKYEETSFQNECSLFDALKAIPHSDRANNKILGFVNLIEGFVEKSKNTSVSKLIESILEDTEYIKKLEEEKTVESETRIENLKEFISVALDFEKNSEVQNLEEFLAGISLVSDLDNLEGQDNAVVLMTLHSAKGLEYPFVFMSGLEEGIFPSFRSGLDETEIEEERRLCYVGITRAMQKLYITSANQRTIYGNTSNYSPSRFMKEIPKNLLNEIGNVSSRKSYDKPTSNKNENSIFSKSFKDRYSSSSTSKDSSVSTGSYSIGDMVEHDKFGVGQIIDIQPMGNDKMLKIDFAGNGLKQLMVSFVKLKVIS